MSIIDILLEPDITSHSKRVIEFRFIQPVHIGFVLSWLQYVFDIFIKGSLSNPVTLVLHNSKINNNNDYNDDTNENQTTKITVTANTSKLQFIMIKT